ncbi:hypothetical protein EAO82_08785 [Halopseudomonas pelagia]|uniref:Uncharacterized protein n=1 Tax=Halopseudomonas pelagia TaxID=553151 RepID=A0AA91U7H1_9GAMM|nr:hypothetical protein CO192_01915 [Halopseudomonas pelagia]QFY56447.1 hypothetical protein EAO82_08785 [Halopseudomonas pelagia]
MPPKPCNKVFSQAFFMRQIFSMPSKNIQLFDRYGIKKCSIDIAKNYCSFAISMLHTFIFGHKISKVLWIKIGLARYSKKINNLVAAARHTYQILMNDRLKML